MVWAEYIHHVSLHFPIVGALVVSAVGIWWVRTDDDRLGQFVRFGGWGLFALTTVAMISGIASAPGWFGGDGPLDVIHHRNMGVTVWCCVATAAIAFEAGHRSGEVYVKRFGALAWSAAAFIVVGAGHWGGTIRHSDKIPWQQTVPVMEHVEAEKL